jgi:uncharacterized coiled-coil protein SlyX
MSDDLVKQLRTPVGYQDLPYIQEQAADRIEELEAKLAKAVQTISKVMEDVNWMLNEKRFLNHHVFDYLDTTLAELSSVSCANSKGEK